MKEKKTKKKIKQRISDKARGPTLHCRRIRAEGKEKEGEVEREEDRWRWVMTHERAARGGGEGGGTR